MTTRAFKIYLMDCVEEVVVLEREVSLLVEDGPIPPLTN